ncbi:MAG: sel1 repeat family protein [Bacteroidales bacterium]|nr:sel1 repeat family protein [Bacteroidales bacterium]
MKRRLVFLIIILFCSSLAFTQNLEQKAKIGNVQAMHDLAKEYYSGIGRLQNKATALTWFERAANKNHIESMYSTAQMYEKGETTKVDLRKAFNYYILAAEKGHFASQLVVAQKLEKGEGTSKSDSRAYLWYRVCAERDEQLACRKLGDYFKEGKIVPKDHSQAKFWYEKAIEKNDIEAKASLAYLYIADEGLAPNFEKAKELNQDPLKELIPTSFFVEGMINKQEEGEAKKKAAFENLLKSRQFGIEKANYHLAMMYYNGEGTPKNVSQAFKIMETLKSDYDSEVGYIMANAYRNGEGVEVDQAKAIENYKKSANADNIEACKALAQIYKTGWGVKKNIKESRLWEQKANMLTNPTPKNAKRK